jgi:hypothetical protein
MKKNILTIGPINIHMDRNLVFKNDLFVGLFDDFKLKLSNTYPEIVLKYKIKSKLLPGAKIVHQTNWSGVFTELYNLKAI